LQRPERAVIRTSEWRDVSWVADSVSLGGYLLEFFLKPHCPAGHLEAGVTHKAFSVTGALA
jgi:hypothetical protein